MKKHVMSGPGGYPAPAGFSAWMISDRHAFHQGVLQEMEDDQRRVGCVQSPALRERGVLQAVRVQLSPSYSAPILAAMSWCRAPGMCRIWVTGFHCRMVFTGFRTGGKAGRCECCR